MIKINKTDSGGHKVSLDLIPRLNIGLIFQILALMSSWALHESIVRSFLAFIFGFLYLVAWVLFGDSATKEGVIFAIDYWKQAFV